METNIVKEQQMEIATVTMKEQCFLPPEVWFDLFGWLTRVQLGERASLACRKFCTLARARIEQTRVLPPLRFLPHRSKRPADVDAVPLRARLWRKATTSLGARYRDVVPIAEVAPPENIISFTRIRIYHFDDQVLHFLQLIKHMFTTNLRLFVVEKFYQNVRALDAIMAMLSNANSTTCSLVFDLHYVDDESSELKQIFKYVSQKHVLNSVHLLAFTNSDDHFEDTHRCSDPEMSEKIQFLVNWLCSKPLENGKPRLLGLLRVPAEFRDRLIGSIVMAFLAAEQPVQFLIHFELNNQWWVKRKTKIRRDQQNSNRTLSMENAATGERLVLRQFDAQNLFLRRCPMIDDNAGPCGHEHGQPAVGSEDTLVRELLDVLEVDEKGLKDKQMIFLSVANYGY